MCVRDEIVLKLIDFVLIIFNILVLFVDFGFDIEELISGLFSLTLPWATLPKS
jgi:hypothetical protein